VLGAGAGRAAHTIFEVSRRFSEFTLLKVEIKTGRTHQIRVHLAHVGHPVAGDTIYGGGREKMVRNPSHRDEINKLGRHFLHSAVLSFDHPRSGQRLEFRSELPADLAGFLAGLR
jgi:23S rRNA pseudouridine1911/1915/1917 synthase